MEFQVKVLLITFIITVAIALVIIPILKRLKVGQLERDDGPQSHLKKQGTPTMGGIIIILSIIIVCVGLFIYYRVKEADVAKNILTLLIPAVGFGLIGLIDDFKKQVLKNTKGLKPAYKMLGLLIVSVGYTLYLTNVLKMGTDITIPFLNTSLTLPIWLYIPFSIFVMLATTNAVNLTDGVDGLAASVSTIIITAITVIGIIFGIKEIAIFGSALIGATLAFLLFNLNPAKIFMGDTGSLLLGGAISVMAIYLKIPLLIIIIAIIPLVETISDIIQVLHYKRTGNRVFKMAPLHHHFELSGWKENKIVSIFSIITLIACVIGVLSI